MSDGSTSIAEVSDDVLMDAQTGASQRPVAGSPASVSRKLPPTIQNASISPLRRPDHRACGQSRTLRYGESPESTPICRASPRRCLARSPLPRRPAHRSVRVSASGRDVERRRDRAPSQIHECMDRANAVCMLRQSHRPDEDGIRPLSEQIGRIARYRHGARRSLSRCRSRRPPARRPGLRGIPRCVSRRKRASIPFVASSAFRAPTRKARSPPVWTGNQWVASSVPKSRALGDRRDPVPFEAGFPQRIDNSDLGALLPGVVRGTSR